MHTMITFNKYPCIRYMYQINSKALNVFNRLSLDGKTISYLFSFIVVIIVQISLHRGAMKVIKVNISQVTFINLKNITYSTKAQRYFHYNTQRCCYKSSRMEYSQDIFLLKDNKSLSLSLFLGVTTLKIILLNRHFDRPRRPGFIPESGKVPCRGMATQIFLRIEFHGRRNLRLQSLDGKSNRLSN